VCVWGRGGGGGGAVASVNPERGTVEATASGAPRDESMRWMALASGSRTPPPLSSP
jgi:hypothetical protein